MTPEEAAELERIARLRGRDPAKYLSGEAQTAAEVAWSVTTIPAKAYHDALRPTAGTHAECARDTWAFDQLPREVRLWARELPCMPNCMVLFDLMRWPGADPRAIMRRIDTLVPGRMRELIRRRYGDRHPQLNGDPAWLGALHPKVGGRRRSMALSPLKGLRSSRDMRTIRRLAA